MKASFRKSLTMAGIATVLSGVGGTATAGIIGDAGEAFLVPFAYWNNTPDGGIGSRWNTVINVTIPSTVGGKTIPNIYTANNTTPRGAVVSPPVVSIPADQTPFAAFLGGPNPSWGLHYYFQTFLSVDVCDGPLPVTPEDFNSYRLSELCPGFEDTPGYLIFVTAEGARGNAADFAFFADAYLTADNTDDTLVLAPANQVAWRLPTLPMPDGADVGTPPVITETNQVIETSFPRVEARPITAGIGTFAPLGSRKVIDMMVGDREEVDSGFDLNTLMVVWNASNLTNRVIPPAAVSWDNVGVHLFNSEEFGCSTSIPLPWELNLVWFRDAVEGAGPPFIENHLDQLPGPITTPGPSRYFQPAACLGAGTDDDAFVRFQLPVETDGVAFNDRTAMYGVSLMMWWDGAFAYPASHDPNGDQDPVAEEIPMPSVDAHDRGLFRTSGNIWVAP